MNRVYTALCSVYNTMEECAVNVSLCECLCVFRHMRQYNSRTYTPNPLYSNPNSILYHNRLRDSAAHDQFYAASSSSCSTRLPEELLKKHFAIFVRFVYCYTARIYDTTANTIKRMHNGERRTVIAMINARKSYTTDAVYALSRCFYEFMVLLMKQIRTCAAIGWSKKKGYHFFLVQSTK